jgi:hypothetical protein
MGNLAGYQTPSQIADRLHKSPKWVLYKIKGRGNIKPELLAIRMGKAWFVAEADAEAFIRRYEGQN